MGTIIYKGAMEQFYEKVINNTLNDIDKVHLKLILKNIVIDWKSIMKH